MMVDKRETNPLLEHIWQWVVPEGFNDASDVQLLGRFSEHGEGDAYAGLVKRYGRLVWAVCRHVLRHEQDAEDAFQATFLVLAKKAGSIRKGESLGAWLHRVAYRVAANAKRGAARRRRHEAQGQSMIARKTPSEVEQRETLASLHEEAQRLPKVYREVFVLCCLEGWSVEEAARTLGRREGTVAVQLSRARQRMQQRLIRRGVTLSASLGALALWQQSASATVPPALVNGVIRTARCVAVGGAAGPAVSANAAALADRVFRGFAMKKLAAVLTVSLAAALSLVGIVPVGGSVPDSREELPPRSETPLNLTEVRAKLQKQREKIESLYVEYDIELEPKVEPKLLSLWGIAFFALKQENHDAFKGIQQYHRMIQREELKAFPGDPLAVDPDAPPEVQAVRKIARKQFGDPAGPPKTLPPAEATVAYDGERAWQTSPDGKSYLRTPCGADLRWFSRWIPSHINWLYFVSVGLSGPDQTAAEKHRTLLWSLPEALDRGGYRILPGTEKAGGADCVVLEGNPPLPWAAESIPWTKRELVDRLWLDPEHGWTLRRREWRCGGMLLEQFVNTAPKEVMPGVWLPQECRWERGAPPWAPKDLRDKPAAVYRLVVKKLDINTVKDELFKIPKGAEAIDIMPPPEKGETPLGILN
jgi:RNA polymerase sigma factor (sigma-70 family)